MALSHNPKIVTDGLVLCLDAANPKSYPGSGTTWFDLSGNGNDGTLVNGVGFDSANLGNITFDGANDHVNINPRLLDNANRGTVIVWFNKRIWDSSRWDTIFSKANGLGFNNNHIQISRQSTSDQISLTISNNTSSTTTSVNTGSIEDNVWYQIGMTWNGSVLIGYLNGDEIDRTNTTITIPDNSTHVTLGEGAAGNTSRYFNGFISSCFCYNRALTEAEIKQNFNALRGRYGL